MKTSYNSKWKIAAGMTLAALLALANSASAALTITTTNQNGAAPFTPTWIPATDSLIAGLTPSIALGNFSFEDTNRNVLSLTAGGSLTISTNLGNADDSVGNITTSSNYVTGGNGNGAGSLLVYTLPASANGYNLTNITVYGGWADNGRDGQAFTILYSTAANPASFNYLTTVNYNPTVPARTPSANREVINDSLGGLIATNVYAVEFVFNFPSSENGTVGYGAITVEGTAAVSVVSPMVSITASNQNNPNIFMPTWPVESPSLIAGLVPTTANGNFTVESSAGTPILTDGVLGSSGDVIGFATCGVSGGTTLIYTLNNSSPNGSDVTNIVVYSGWGNADRDGQYYTLSYSTVSAPTTYIPITTVFYNPQGISGASANRVAISASSGVPLGSNVGKVKFDFSAPPNANNFDNAYSGYSEIIVQGHDATSPAPPPSPSLIQDTLPSYAATVVGDQITFTASYSNSPPVISQWLFISGATTNTISTGAINGTNNGVVTSTVTVNDLQTNNSGYYMLEGLNATNGAAAPSYSSSAQLVVNSAPVPANNIVINYAEQAGQGLVSPVNATTSFYPTWTADTNNDLILGFQDGGLNSPGSVYAGGGNFGLAGAFGDPAILSDGDTGLLIYNPGTGGNSTLDTCGPYSTVSGANYPGVSLTYTLDTSSAVNGFDLTNIVVYGGWGDSSQNEQKYQVLYSTVAAPNTFIPMTGWVDYASTDPNGWQSATRSTLTPAAGVMAKNVYAVQISFNNQAAPPKGNYSGYSEIIVGGQAAPARPFLTQDVTPTTAEDVQGSSLTITAGFINATSYQWLKNGTNLVGATSPTLTLTDLQSTDTATNGGYSLTALSASGTNVSSACTVVVDPAPTATSNVITAFAYQTSAAGGFTPTWDTSALGSSLIYGQSPSGGDVSGDFTGGGDHAAGLSVLNDGGYGIFASDGTHPAFATGGPGAGKFVSYSLGSDPNGYTVTNIQIAGGWNDNGRDSQYYTVMYSTVANPTLFYPLVTVEKNLNSPPYGVGDETTVRTTMTPANGVLASNVASIYVDFQYPQGVPNGYSGYSEISIFGSPSAMTPPAGPVITASHEETNNDWTVESPNLIAGQLPSSYGPGVFTEEGCNETNLTDGMIGFGAAFGASCGADGTAVPWIIFSPTNGGSWNLTNIVVYTLWADYGRDGQFYNLSYSTVAAPTTFLPLASVAYNPFVPTGIASGNRVEIAPPVGQTMLATNVAAVKFDFTPQGSEDFGWSGYSEIVLQGTNSAPVILPMAPVLAAPYVSGGDLILTGTGGAPNSAYTWLTTTNLTPPIIWETNLTGSLDGNGAFSNAVPVSADTPERFFRLRQP